MSDGAMSVSTQGDAVTITMRPGAMKHILIAVACVVVLMVIISHAMSAEHVSNMIARRAEIRGAVEAAAGLQSDRCLATLMSTHFPGGRHHKGSGWFCVNDEGEAVDVDAAFFPIKSAHEIDPAHVKWETVIDSIVSRASSSAFFDNLWEKPSRSVDSMRSEIPNITFVTRRRVRNRQHILGYVWYAPETEAPVEEDEG